MPNTTWKQVERRVARTLGGQRVGCNSDRGGPDVVVGDPPFLLVQVKHRRSLPRWVKSALASVRRSAGPDRLGIVVLHEHQARNSLVVMNLADFRDWFGENGARPVGLSADNLGSEG